MKTTLLPKAHQLLFEAEGFTAEMCLEQESLDLAYHLRYKAYLHAEGVSANKEERVIDAYDGQKNTRTFLIWHEGRPVASVRSFTWSADYDWERTPSIDLFEESVSKTLGLQTTLLESNRYVVDPEFKGRKSLTAQMLLFRIQSVGALLDQCAYVITAVRPKHVRFYERFMNFYPISEPIEIDMVTFPIQLLATPIASCKKLAESSAIAAFQQSDLDNYLKCLNTLKAA